MMNKTFYSNLTIAMSFIALLTVMVSHNAHAKYSKRAHKWESTFKIVYGQDADISAQGGSNLDISSDVGWGFSLGYNLNQHILFNYDFSLTTPRYNANFVTDDGANIPLNYKMDLYESQFNVTYNVMTSAFTPYVQAGLGWSYIDSNIANGPPGTVCWWDPWYGYICNGYQSTYDDTRFSYNVAAGFRYELPNYLTLKVSYKQGFIDLSHSDNASIGSYHFEIGSIF